MLTVNIKTKKDQMVVSEEILQVTKIIQNTTEYKYFDNEKVDHPGIELHYDDEGNYKYLGPWNNGQWYEVFVMNENGVTIARLVL